jgi:hypothetical protein
MLPIHRTLAIGLALALLGALGGGAGTAARVRPSATHHVGVDVAITRMTADRAHVGETILVQIVTVNRGPDPDPDHRTLFVVVATSANLQLDSLDCNFEAGNHVGGSDGSQCEYYPVPVGSYATTTAHVLVHEATARSGSVTACVISGDGINDPTPHNECRTVQIPLAGADHPQRANRRR